MSGNDELTIIEPDSFFQILYQLYLPCGRQAVFRLIKKIQGAFFDLISKISKSILTIGILLRVLSELFQYKFRPTVISRLLHLDIRGYSGTVAESYARDNGFTFISLGKVDRLLGDSDGDDSVTIVDATVIQRHLAEIPTAVYIEAAADADQDGRVTIIDDTCMPEKQRGKPSRKGNKLFRLSFVTATYKYELHELLRNDYDYESFIKVRSYEIGKTRRLDIPD